MQWGPGVDTTKLAHDNDKVACQTCHLSWTTSCAGCHLPIQANAKTERHHYEGGETPQLRDVQPAGRARRHVPAGPQRAGEGQQDRAGALEFGAGAVVDQHQSRAHLHPAAADRRERLFVAGVRAALSAHRAQDRDQDLHRLPRVGRQRQQRDHGAALAAGNQLRQLRRLQRLGRRGKARQRRAGDRMGRAAGGHRQLPAPLRLSGLVRGAPEARQAAADDRHARHEGRGALPAVARRVPIRGRRRGRHARLRRRQRREQGRVAEDHHRAVLAARPRHAHRVAQRDVRGAADQPADQSAAQRRRIDARHQPGAAVPSDLQLCGDHRCRRGPDPHRRHDAGRWRAAEQFPDARRHVERGQVC